MAGGGAVLSVGQDVQGCLADRDVTRRDYRSYDVVVFVIALKGRSIKGNVLALLFYA